MSHLPFLRFAPLAVLTVLPCLEGCARTVRFEPQTVGAHASAGWRTFTPGEMGLRCELPASAQLETNRVTEPDGATSRHTAAHWDGGGALMAVRVARVDQGLVGRVRDVFDSARASMLESLPELARVELEERYGWSEGFPTLQLAYRGPEGTVVVRAYAGTDTVYVVAGGWAAERSPGAAAAVQRFLGSVRLDSAHAPDESPMGSLTLEDWQYVVAPLGEFACEMPGRPEPQAVETSIEGEQHRAFHYRIGTAADAEFTVRVIELGERPSPETLKKLTERRTEGEFTVLDDRAAQMNGFAGRVTEAISKSKERVRLGRMHLTPTRIYEFYVTAPEARRDVINDAAERFFASCHIL